MGGTVRQATDDDAINILSSIGVVERLLCKPSRIINGDAYIINERLLLVLIEHSESEVEAHIGQAKENWQHIHDDIQQSLIFIQSLGYNQVYTNVRESLKTTLNLLAKHDFKQMDTIESEVILKWALKQDS